MIQLKCPHCTKEIRAADEHAGKKIRCPKCKEVLALPAANTAVQSAASSKAPAPIRKAAPPPLPKRRPADDEPAVEAIEEDDDVPVIRSRRDEREDDEDEDDEEIERQRRKRKKRKRRQGAYADCPNCGGRGNASRVGFTWWGGLVGPAILCHVRCNDCGTCYNGRSGKSNNAAIGIYLGISAVLGLMLSGCVIGMAILNK